MASDSSVSSKLALEPSGSGTSSEESPAARTDVSVLRDVHRVATALFTSRELDDILLETLSAALRSVDALAGSLFLHDPKDDTLVFRHVIGGAGSALIGIKIPAVKGVAGGVFQSGQAVVTGQASKDSRHVEVAQNFQTQAMVTVPLRSLGGTTIGVMQVLNKADGGLFSEDYDLVILETLASLAATAIENAHRAERERKAAVADAVGDIAHDIKNMMTPVESWAATLEMIAVDSSSAMARLQANIPPGFEDDLAAAREILDLLPDGLAGICDGAQQAKDRGAEIADALKGNVREPIFICEDVARTVNRVCKTLQPTARARGVDISMEGDLRPFPHDRTHLFNAVYNLVNNAIPYVPPGGSIRVLMSEVDGSAEIAVADTGRGMPEHIRASLFTEHTVSTTAGGTGLGTQIVARVARAHSGTVTVESEIGKGSIFRLRIPLTRPANPE